MSGKGDYEQFCKNALNELKAGGEIEKAKVYAMLADAAAKIAQADIWATKRFFS